MSPSRTCSTIPARSRIAGFCFNEVQEVFTPSLYIPYGGIRRTRQYPPSGPISTCRGGAGRSTTGGRGRNAPPTQGCHSLFCRRGAIFSPTQQPCQKHHTAKQYWPLISCKVVIVWRHRCLVKRNFHVPKRALYTMLDSRRSYSAELLAQIHSPQRRAPKQSYFGSIAALSTQTALLHPVILLPCQK